ncbi:hypothetical protein PsYK624_028340 [Phanerochaete sordida]|uniref:DUF6533 domain-containing protein n=1 Tax=Phanerochaete sordida TaxID=48140 RepID=A0A9P3G1W9_9APHY|nr:hypothetical protein PsYK624_028340 [Phanerochaete sordida]
MTRSPLDDTSAAPLSATESYANFVRNNYFSVSARVLFLWDYCLTIDREVQYIWNSKASPASALFLINRYANLLITIMELLEQGSFQTAKQLWTVHPNSGVDAAGRVINRAFATLRIYAIWDCDWRPALPVGMLGLASFALNILIYANQTTEKAPAPSTGCAAEIRIPYYRYHHPLCDAGYDGGVRRNSLSPNDCQDRSDSKNAAPH